MKKLFVGMIIGLGLVFGVGNEVGATNEMSEVSCNGECVGVAYEVSESEWNEREYMDDCEYYEFEEMIHDLYIEEYCVNYCEECDSYYYEECYCEYECEYDDCEHDYEIFVEDYYEMIMDEYHEVLRGIIDERNNPKVEVVICEF